MQKEGEKMPKQMQYPAAQEDRNLVADVQSALIRNGLTKDDLAVYLHMTTRTLYHRLRNPGDFKLNELRTIKKKLKMELQI